MVKPKATMRDVAKKAGVSATTVSRYMKDHSSVSEPTERKIREAMREVNYRFNQVAHNLHSKKTNMISVLLGNSASPMSAQAIKGIESVASEKDYIVSLYNTYFSPEREAHLLEVLIKNQVDGIILASCASDAKLLQEIMDRDIALVLLDRQVPGIQTDHVRFDFFKISKRITEHLISRGCKRIAVICRKVDKIHRHPQLKGFRAALSEASISCRQPLYPCTPFDDAGYDAMKQIILSGPLPDAVYLTTGIFVMGAVRCCREMGIKIPKDMKMACIDSLGIYNDLMSVSLTCNDLPAFDLGVRAAEALLRRIEINEEKRKSHKYPKEEYQEILLEGELIIGGSTMII